MTSPLDVATRCELTSSQREVWFEQMLHPGLPLYHIGGYLRIHGAVDVALFEQAVNRVVATNDALRIVLLESGLPPRQEILDGVGVKVPFIDFSGQPDSTARLHAWMRQAFLAPFRFQGKLLFEFALAAAGQDDFYWLMKYHHIIVDGWSTALVVQRVAAAYNQLAGEGPAPPESHSSFLDFAIRDPTMVPADAQRNAQAYWLAKFRTLPEPLLCKKPGREDAQSGRITLVLPRSSYSSLEQLGRECGGSVFQVILAILYTYFLRIRDSGDAEFVIGLPTANRSGRDCKRTVGMFAGVAPARFAFGLNLAFSALVREIARELRRDYRHYRLPLGEINKLLGLRQTGREQLFDLTLSYEKHNYDTHIGRAATTVHSLANGHDRTPLAVYLRDYHAGHDVPLEFEYRRDYFTDREIAACASRLEHLLREVVRHPDRPVRELAIMTPEERRLLLAEPGPGCAAPALVDLLAAQAAKTPDATALLFEGGRWTFADLNQRANLLAHALRLRGAAAETTIAVCLTAPEETALAMLAVLKTGAAYVPLDPDQPAARLAAILEDTHATLAVTRSGLTLPDSRIGTVLLDEARPHLPLSTPAHPANAASLAYIVYTSGSSGRPKGIAISNGALANHATAVRDAYGLGPSDRVLRFAAPGFDVAAEELFPTWLAGACAVSGPPTLTRRLDVFLKFITRRRISVLNLPVSFWRAWLLHLNQTGSRPPADLRLAVVGNEAVRREDLATWRDLVSEHLAWCNAYGPSETTITATLYAPTPAPSSSGPVPIGRPIAGMQALILARNLELLPCATPGELCLAGEGLARGYLGRPDLTAAAFIPHPFASTPGQRLYRSGDRGLRDEDGDIVFLGRLDRQVKLRGFRIELGEIETTLARHPGVARAAVILEGKETGQRRLIAYHTAPKRQVPPASASLKSFLQSHLPAHMIPAVFVALERFPLTPGGKLDYAALPQPRNPGTESELRPRNRAEQQLAAIWQEVLGIDKIGVSSNFFELGGDSILSLRICARASQAGLKLNPDDIFNHQTIADLANAALPHAPAAAARAPAPVRAPLTPMQQWFFEQDMPHPHGYCQSLSLRLAAGVPEPKLRRAFASLGRLHPALHLRFRNSQQGRCQTLCESRTPFPIAILDVSRLPAAEVGPAINQTCSAQVARLNFEDGPLLAAALLRTGSPEDRLFIAIHHLVVDGISWHILLEDLALALDRAEADPAQPGDESASFSAWAEALAVRPGLSAAETAYWLELFKDESPPRLPYTPTQPGTARAAGRHRLDLSEQQTRNLLHHVHAAYHTRIDDFLVAALAQSLRTMIGRNRLLIELEGHGREQLFDDLDIARTVGWFTCVFPLLLELPASGQPDRLLVAVKEQLRRVPRRGLGHGLLRYCSPDAGLRARLRSQPRAQVLFNYLGQWDEALRQPPFLGPAEDLLGTVGFRDHPLEIDAVIRQGRLETLWSFEGLAQEWVAALADKFMTTLTGLIEHCLAPDSGAYTPSDLPLAGLDRAGLKRALGNGRDMEDLYPLSPLQEGLLFHHLNDRSPSVYIGQVSFRIRGPLQAGAFKRAWSALIDRHAVLRTSFLWQGLQRPLQRVHRRVALDWREIDLGRLTSAGQEERLQAVLREERQRPFDLERPPLLRLALVGGASPTFIWTHHHLILDGWSLAIIMGELFQLYHALASGNPSDLPNPRPFRQFIAWREGCDRSEAETYWRRQLRGFTAPTPLPCVRETASDQYAMLDFRLPAALTADLQELQRRRHLTLDCLTRAAWALLLWRYGGGSDIVFGVTVSGRPAHLPGITGMCGLFINTLPVRMLIRRNTRLHPWLQELLLEQGRREPFSQVPLVDIRACSTLPRGTPLFESLHVFENYPLDPAKWLGFGLEIEDIRSFDRTHYPLTLTLLPGESGLAFRLQYDPQRFDEALIQALPGHLQHLLAGMAAGVDTRLGDLDILGAAERRRLLEAAAGPVPSAQDERFIQDVFAATARRRPQAPAIVWEEPGGDPHRTRVISYEQLAAEAETLAGRLVAAGARPETPVAVILESGPHLIVSFLAVLKTGAVYLPISPQTPAARLAYLIESCAASCVLTERPFAPRVPAHAGLIFIDEAVPDPAESVREVRPFSAAQLAYLIFTSGSTGKPKGVAVPHAGCVNLARFAAHTYRVGEADRIALATSPVFDVWLSQVMMAWYGGAALCLTQGERITPGPGLAAFCNDQRVTLLTLTASGLAAMPSASLETVTTLINCGEACRRELADSWSATLRFFNEYGPTEATICTTLAGPMRPGKPVTIGKPLDNQRTYLTNDDLELVADGVLGELMIASPGLARGYDRRPDLTAAAFVPDPFGREPGGRLYHSGDVARREANGELTILGRRDHQVKIRGFRIELGEIEAVLAGHPDIAQCVVLADAVGSDRQLIAYLEIKLGREQPDPPRLRTFLSRFLPEYMLPARFLVLDKLARTGSGKIDRARLPAPEMAPRVDRVPPQSPLQELLHQIWARVLSLNPHGFGIEDHFFDLGGHSLNAMRIITRIQDTFGSALSPRDLFEAPNIRLLAARLQEKRGNAVRRLPPPAERPPRLPLSPAQERLWLLDRLDGASAAYNIPLSLRLRGLPRPAALAQAIGAIQARHESLRTRIELCDHQPRQIITDHTAFHLPLIDLSGLPAARAAAAAARLAERHALTPFDPGRPPLFRAHLLRVEPRDCHLLLNFHHLIADAWSTGIFFAEMAHCYNGRPADDLAPLTYQYADYSLWQRALLAPPETAGLIAYWRRNLAGASGRLALPRDRPRPSGPVRSGAVYRFAPTADLAADLGLLARANDVTPFMVLYAVFADLLGRYAGTEDLTIGTPVANRPASETEPLIGCFTNTLVLRADLSGNATLGELLVRARETALAAYDHQDLPFESLVEALQPPRDPGRPPLFQVMFTFQNSALAPPPLTGLEVTHLESAACVAKFDLTLAVRGAGDRLEAGFEFRPDLFDETTIARLARHYLNLLRAYVTSPPESRRAALAMMDAAEREQMIRDWNRTAAEFPADRCLHQLIADQARRTPEAIAVDGPRGRLSYAALDRRADLLAAHLQALGLMPEMTAATLLDPSPDLIVALLAILKAGGAYVPLAVDEPDPRQAAMLALAAPRVIIGREHRPAPLAGNATLVPIDSHPQPAAAPVCRSHPLNGAYILFTSGSTGEPKGVTVCHRSLVNYLTWAIGAYRVAEGAGAPLITATSFDATVTSMWAPLLAGKTVVLPATRESGAPLVEPPAAASAYSFIKLTPTHLDLWARSADPLPNLATATLILGGEPVSGGALDPWRQPGRTIVNEYGPTEATVGCAIWTDDGTVDPSGALPIGSPIANMRLHVLDDRLEPVPAGVSGELFIGGAGLARCYLGAPRLTASRFLPDPFSPLPGERLYRSGDLACRGAGGELQFRGRRDGQIKIRGFRVEIGEIESQLARHPAVADCAVIVRRDEAAGPRLIAFLTAADGQRAGAIPQAEWRAFLATRLPDYMLPTAFVLRDGLPLTEHGKRDRTALATEPLPTIPESQAITAPGDPVEEILLGIWREVLPDRAVARTDNFFALGGHSLSAAQVASRIGAAFRVTLPLRTLFEAPTIAALARAVSACRNPAPPALVARQRPAVLPLSFAQQRLWFLARLGETGAAYHIPLTLRLTGGLDVAALTRALGALCRRHESLRTRFEERDHQPCQVIDAPSRFQLSLVDVSRFEGDCAVPLAEKIAETEARKPFDLAHGPLWRGYLIRLDAQAHHLLLTLHHIIFDGWSADILIEELASHYNRAVTTQTSPGADPPPLPVQYADYAVQQRGRQEPFSRQLAYWRARLASAPEVVDLPLDRPRATPPAHRSGGVAFRLDDALTRRLKALAGRNRATLFMVLQALLAELLARYGQSEDILIGTPVANRPTPETERIVGCFVNTLALRTDLSGDPSLADLLDRVRTGDLAAYDHQDLPFEKLVEALGLTGDGSRTPLFQVLLTLHRRADLPRFAGLQASLRHPDTGSAKFDISLYLDETTSGLDGWCEYRRDLFDRETIVRLMAHFTNLAEAFACTIGEDTRHLSSCSMLSPDELAELLAHWNGAERDSAGDRCLHELFEERAARHGDRTALVWGAIRFDYAWLNNRAEELAQRLRVRGVGIETPVGIYQQRSPWLIVSLLACLKAGGAYVPMDREDPPERLRRIVAEAGIDLVLTTGDLALPLAEVATLVADATSSPEAPGEPVTPSPANAAYILFTSGSTGTPKGVVMSHRGLVNYLRWSIAAYGLDESACVPLFTALTFDATVTSLWAPLLAGGSLRLLAEDTPTVNLAALADTTPPHDLVKMTPAHLEIWRQMTQRSPAAKVLVLGGEAVRATTVASLPAAGVRIFNEYGPTEAAVGCCAGHPEHKDHEHDRFPVGRPIANMRLYVLDRSGRPLPAGAVGDWFIGGPGLARGYLGRPALTAAAFLPDPFSRRPGERIYRSGDRGRMLTDGRLDFLGRRDFQVKLRGFRIETGDIEARLRQYPSIQEAVVVVREDVPGDRRLVAYLVPARTAPGNAPAAIEPRELRRFLARALPHYMLPGALVSLPSLPLTGNGKIDRAALPIPDPASPVREHPVPPRTPLERRLAELWREVLQAEPAGVFADFFESGGHSLLVMQLISRIREAFRIQCDPRLIFNERTIEGMAAKIERILATRQEIQSLSITEEKDDDEEFIL